MNIALQSNFHDIFIKPTPLRHVGEIVPHQLRPSGEGGKGDVSSPPLPV